MKILWTRESLTNLADIEAFISEDNPEKAIEFIDYLIKQCERLIQNPYSGRVIREIGLPIKVGNFTGPAPRPSLTHP